MKRCVETSGVETKLRARVSTLVSCRNSLWEKKPMFLDHFSWWTISNFMPLEFLVVCTSLSCFLNMGLEYICLRCNADTRHFLSIF